MPASELLTPLADFNVSINPRTDEAGIAGSEDSHFLTGDNGTASFSVDFTYGFDRYTGFTPYARTAEPDTIHIWFVFATGGHGLGSAATAALVEHAKEEGFHQARMGIVNPRMVGVVRKLQRLGIINASYFRPEFGHRIQPQPATEEMMHEPDIVSADAASALFIPETQHQKPAEEDNEFVAIDCAILF